MGLLRGRRTQGAGWALFCRSSSQGKGAQEAPPEEGGLWPQGLCGQFLRWGSGICSPDHLARGSHPHRGSLCSQTLPDHGTVRDWGGLSQAGASLRGHGRGWSQARSSGILAGGGGTGGSLRCRDAVLSKASCKVDRGSAVGSTEVQGLPRGRAHTHQPDWELERARAADSCALARSRARVGEGSEGRGPEC